MDKELTKYLIFEPDTQASDIFVLGRFRNIIIARILIKTLRKVGKANEESIFRVYVYNKGAEDADIIKHGFQIGYMNTSTDDSFKSTVEYSIGE